MTVSASDAARHICVNSDWTCTNLQLQKILYLAQMFYMGENNGDRLINTSFEAWDYGPVSPTIYHKVKAFGSGPILDIFRLDNDKSPEMKYLDEECDQLLLMKPAELVAITHWEQGAWAHNYHPGAKGIDISDGDILKEYGARTEPVDE